MGPPTISVVLPVWNGARFVREAIESILAQTFSALELIVADDGSTDETRTIVEELAARDPRVVILGLDHGGIVHALNAGIERARGRYVARMDADDVAMPQRLERQLAYLEAHPECVAAGSDVEVIDEEGHPIGAAQFPRTHHAIERGLLSGWSTSLAHPTVVIRTDALRTAGCYRSEMYPSEDLDLWLRLSELGELANVPEKLLRYRRHRDTVSVRERRRQSATTARIVDAARRRRGLEPVNRRAASIGATTTATYHFDCACIALGAGKRLAALRHAGASIFSAPFWLKPYAALVACILPTRTLVRLYSALRAIRF